MSAATQIEGAFSSEHATGALYVGMLGLIISDIIPTPADALYFYVEKDLRDKWKAGQISAKQYWIREAAAYYGLNPLWWVLVFLLALSIQGNWKKKMNVALVIIGVGAVIGVLYRNVKKDIEAQRKEIEEQKYTAKFSNAT